ncbi:hypothetical protein [Absidia glauca]|uniref:F-BAR domain-containing protein n=1 Tax=Absidia glauca TaxID=4829 RepID=A0A163JFL2_ABSGL|nr:hypothetical protein [Absidia glauca]
MCLEDGSSLLLDQWMRRVPQPQDLFSVSILHPSLRGYAFLSLRVLNSGHHQDLSLFLGVFLWNLWQNAWNRASLPLLTGAPTLNITIKYQIIIMTYLTFIFSVFLLGLTVIQAGFILRNRTTLEQIASYEQYIRLDGINSTTTADGDGQVICLFPPEKCLYDLGPWKNWKMVMGDIWYLWLAPVPKSFANNFWGKDDAGYNVLTAKMANSKKTFDDLKAFYTARSCLHEEFGKKLMKHLKNDLGRDETGTLGLLLTSAYKELEMTAQANIELAQKIKVNLELRLDNFILDQKDTRKLVQTSVDKAHRNKQLHTAHVAKAKEKYESECVKQISYEGQLTTAGFREADRLRQKLERCTHDIGVFEQEYKSACAKLADATTVWDNEWKYACDKYQEMEEKRVEFMHHSFSVYVNILSTTTNHDQEGTGALIPDPPVYVHYMDDPAKTLPTYHTAQFPSSGKKAAIIEHTKTLPSTSDHHQENGSSSHERSSKATNRYSYQSANKQATSSDSTSTPTGPTSGSRSTSVRQAPPPQQRIGKRLPTITKKEIVRKTAPGDTTHSGSYEKKMTPSTSTSSSLSGMCPPNSSSMDTEESDMNQQDDVEIDPRAKVVFAIGNNVFEVDNKQKGTRFGQDAPKTSGTSSSSKHRQTSLKKDQKVDEAFDLSIKELLEELGVYGSSTPTTSKPDRSNHSKNRSSAGGMATTGSNDTTPRSSHHENYHCPAPRNNQPPAEQQPPSMYKQLQQHYAFADTSPQEPHPIQPMAEQSMLPKQEGIQWARALYDHHATDGYLSFFQGNWLAVTRIENDVWCLAYLWDAATESLSAHPGYVACNHLQFLQ